MNLRHIAITLGLASITLLAHAQKVSVPVMDFVGIPTATAGLPSPSAADVKRAIEAAALSLEWDIKPESDGSLLASAKKDGHHRLAVRFSYDAKQFTVRYVSSEDLHYKEQLSLPQQVGQNGVMHAEAEAEQRKRFAAEFESNYATKTVAVIHPVYEEWVRELMSSVRRHLRATNQ